MKSSKITLALATAALLAPVAAQADTTPGWYVGAGVGLNIQQDSFAHTPSGDTKVPYNPGFSYLADGGYAWDNGLRVEGEIFRSRANVKSSPLDGHLGNTDLFVNGLYDFKTGSMFSPYVGAGIGLALASADKIGKLKTGGYLDGDNNAEFAYQAIAGVAAQLDPNWALTLDYRYIGAFSPKIDLTTGGASRTNDQQHDFIFGIRYSFGETVVPAQTTAPAVAAPKAAKAAVAPIPQSYMVFFDFDKSDLTPEAKRILASAAQDYKRGGYVRIVVTGHTDTMGSAKYNIGLSEKRANSVKAELAKLGVDSKVVVAKGVGKDGLLVPTADQVREAQNRRAEIVFNKQ